MDDLLMESAKFMMKKQDPRAREWAFKRHIGFKEAFLYLEEQMRKAIGEGREKDLREHFGTYRKLIAVALRLKIIWNEE